MKPTTREILALNELLRLESTEVQKLQAMLPMVGDEDLGAEIQSCIQDGTKNLKALVAFCKAQQLI